MPLAPRQERAEHRSEHVRSPRPVQGDGGLRRVPEGGVHRGVYPRRARAGVHDGGRAPRRQAAAREGYVPRLLELPSPSALLRRVRLREQVPGKYSQPQQQGRMGQRAAERRRRPGHQERDGQLLQQARFRGAVERGHRQIARIRRDAHDDVRQAPGADVVAGQGGGVRLRAVARMVHAAQGGIQVVVRDVLRPLAAVGPLLGQRDGGRRRDGAVRPQLQAALHGRFLPRRREADGVRARQGAAAGRYPHGHERHRG